MTSGDDGLAEVARAVEQLGLWLRRRVPARLSTTAVTTLDTLLRDGPLRISDLAEHEAISQPGMTGLVNRLEAEGLAERVPDPTDGRATLVRVTDGGRRQLRERSAERIGALTAALECLDADERAALVAALPAVRKLVEPNQRTLKSS